MKKGGEEKCFCLSYKVDGKPKKQYFTNKNEMKGAIKSMKSGQWRENYTDIKEINSYAKGGGVAEGDKVTITTSILGKAYLGMNGEIMPRKLLNDKYSIKLDNGMEMAFSKDEFKHNSINPKYKTGGGVGNKYAKEDKAMLHNQNKEIMHHSKEMEKIINKQKHIEPFVVAKMNRATTDLSDLTHYLDGDKYKKGGGVGTIKERVIDYYINNSDNEDLINLMGVNDVPNLIPVAEKWVNNRNSYYDKIFSAIDGIHNRTWAENKFEELGLEKFSNGGNLGFTYTIGGL